MSFSLAKAREAVARMSAEEGRWASGLTAHEAMIWLEIRHEFPDAELVEAAPYDPAAAEIPY